MTLPLKTSVIKPKLDGLGTISTQNANNVSITGGAISGMSSPSATGDVATKGYVDTVGAGRTWLKPVKSFLNLVTSEPASPASGDRYINTDTGDSSETTTAVTANRIYEWDGTDWVETTPDVAAAVTNRDDSLIYVWNGTDWVETGTGGSHNSMSDLQGGTAEQYYHMTATEHTGLHAKQHAIDSSADHTGFGTAVTKNVGTGAEDVSAGNHGHADLHAHANKLSLDLIGQDEGEPLWDGLPWPGSVLIDGGRPYSTYSTITAIDGGTP